MLDLSIRGGRVVLPDGVRAVDVGIENGKVVSLEASCPGAAEEIDATGLHVLPGVVDPHVHFNEPGRTEWEGFATGTSALAAGGGTCFIDMPLNSEPPLLDVAALEAKRDAGLGVARTDFAFWGGLTPDSLEAMEPLADAGVAGFKAFMCGSGIASFGRADDATLLEGMRNAAALGLPVAVHAESDAITTKLTDAFLSQGRRDWPDFLASRPVEAEIEAVETALAIAKETGCQLHVVHASHPRVVELIHQARIEQNIGVTCETCPHYLAFTEHDLEKLGAIAKCAPPLRDADAVSGLWEALRGGRIDWVASDHSPCPPELKQGGDAFAAWGGIAGVQSTLSVLLSYEPALALPTLAAVTADHAAERFGLSQKGRIELGFDADLVVIDLEGTFALSRDMLQDRHRLSPYLGKSFRGVVKRTVLRGKTILMDGAAVGEARGQWLKPGP